MPEDFIVDEQMEIALTGSGEHLWVQVRKTGANTDWVAGQLARCACQGSRLRRAERPPCHHHTMV
ncbi:tRNA pseudouridine(13) synthase TruD [Thiothrix caldifontis]|uniref:tRNA pseudouridine(13) synthase TruD n=1 Tax=Thiothrix caldifontis TaxID=525918 RepID=UPI0024819A28|nr:tRNA pseudouridine(13) synthase TruD [Thiothrix caldifontis]